VTRTDYPLPFDHQLQAKPAYWGVVDETQLPGYGLKFSSTTAKTGHDTFTITITGTNGDVGPAYATQIGSLTLEPLWSWGDRGDRKCSATVTAPSAYPVTFGDIATSGTATAVFNVTLSHCDNEQRFVLKAPWSSSVYDTGTFFTILDFDNDRDDHHEHMSWNRR